MNLHLAALVDELKKCGLKEKKNWNTLYWTSAALSIFFVFLILVYEYGANKEPIQIETTSITKDLNPTPSPTEKMNTESNSKSEVPRANTPIQTDTKKSEITNSPATKLPDKKVVKSQPTNAELSKLYSNQLKVLQKQLVVAEDNYKLRCIEELEPSTKVERDQCHKRYYGIVEDLRYEISDIKIRIAGLGGAN